MADRIHIAGTPTAQQALELHTALFPEPGTYEIENIAKAAMEQAAATEDFREWFLRRLMEVGRQRFVTAQQVMWDVLDGLLRSHNVQAPSQLSLWELNRTLFDLSTASTARMVGFHVPEALVDNLRNLGFTLPEALDFPAVAYRMGLIYDRLAQSPVLEWPELNRLAQSFPLSSAERAAVEIARSRAGVWLQPVFRASGEAWVADREIEPLRERVARAIETRQGRREAGRQLSNEQRAQGIIRDGDRVMRTEIANAEIQGAWQHDSKTWPADALLFRQPSINACRECLRLYLNPDGTPRLYERLQLEAWTAQGPNRGPREEWRAIIGATHPHCACGPWARWRKEFALIGPDSTKRFADRMREVRAA